MLRKNKILIIAFGVMVLLGGGYYGSTVWKKSTQEDNPYIPSEMLGNMVSHNIVKMELSGLVFEKKGQLWELVSVNGETPPPGLELDQWRLLNLTNSLANLWIERLVDEAPADLSVYGLDNPSNRVTLTDFIGKKVVYLLGDPLPQRSTHYVMEEGDPNVYSVPSHSIEGMWLTLNDFRNRRLYADFDVSGVTELHIENGDTRIQIIRKPVSSPSYLAADFINFIMTSPYKLARAVDGEIFENYLAPLKNLEISEFVDNYSASPGTYGLDKPAKLYLNTSEGILDLLVGNEINGSYYAKRSDTPGIFIVSGLDSVIKTRPFTLLLKIPLLLNIDQVDSISVTGGKEPLSAEIRGLGNSKEYFLNGKRAEEESFKAWYWTVAGLVSDAEMPGLIAVEEDEVITIEYRLIPAEQLSISLIPYNRDFYALRQEGTIEFLVSRNQIGRIFDAADTMIFDNP